MSEIVFASPEEAEDAFYKAFETADIETMMRVWLDADYVECIHPMSHRLMGIDEIRESWQEIFSNKDNDIHFETIETRQIKHKDLAIHVVNENLKMKGNQTTQILATNIYEKTADGWHMILHHASPAPQQIPMQAPPTVH